MTAPWRSRSICGGLLAVTTTVLAVACGARSTLLIPEGEDPEGGSGGGVAAPDCAVFESSTELAPLDMFILLDASGSMQQNTAQGSTKWQAIRSAVEDFSTDGESAGINVALGFFPINDPAVPTNCKSDGDCGAPDSCDFFDVCSTTFELCTTDQDCADAGFPNDSCTPLGQCTSTPALCLLDGTVPCAGDTGPCAPLGGCRNRTICEPDAYGEPVVALTSLPGGGPPLLQAIDLRSPDGATPTRAALAGTIARAADQIAASPSHEVIVLLATDGFPTACDDDIEMGAPEQAITNVAEAAALGASQGIQTFVIGVFAPDQQSEAQANLDLVAAAGGSKSAFVVSTSDQVSSGFLEALNRVRLDAKACEFDLASDDIDPETVWLRLTPKEEGEPIWIPRVDGPEDCDDDEPGFHFDVPIDATTPPSKVVLCPSTCSLLGASTDRTVDIFTTCPDPTG